MRVTFLDGAMEGRAPIGILYERAYDSSGASMDVGVVPEPSTYALLLWAVPLVLVVVQTVKKRSEAAADQNERP